jgi:ABC-type lipoprotein release transport system permease subunit
LGRRSGETKAVLEPRRKQRGETSGEFQIISSIERMGELNLVLTTIKLTLVGLVAGVWPARRAAAVFPAEALRAD